jgi:pSer/pThr/pTyr-binding forkhead associated (FHA) protein
MTVHATQLDHRGLVRGRTEDVDALDRPRTEPDAPNVPLAPGRYLLVEQSGHVRAIALTRQITHLGRGFAATVQLEDPGVSRRHAIVVQRRGSARILDDRSANGTWVNGRRVFDAELHDGDVILLGRALLVYRERPAAQAA